MDTLPSDLKYVEMIIDSSNAEFSNYGGITKLNWPKLFITRDISNICGMKIISALIPYSWYVINPTNNTFILYEGLDLSNPLTVTLPIGNYNPTQLAGVIEDALDAAGAAAYTVTYNPNLSKFTFSNGTIPFRFQFGSNTYDTGATNPRYALGFNGGLSGNPTFTIDSPNVLQLSGSNYIYLNSTRLGPSTSLYLPKDLANTGGASGPQIAMIPVTCNPGETIFYNDPNPQIYFDLDNRVGLDEADFYLTFGNTLAPIDLNGDSFSLKIGFWLHRSIKGYIGKNTTAKLYFS